MYKGQHFRRCVLELIRNFVSVEGEVDGSFGTLLFPYPPTPDDIAVLEGTIEAESVPF